MKSFDPEDSTRFGGLGTASERSYDPETMGFMSEKSFDPEKMGQASSITIG